jgi:uncharacterized protein (DUF58 family)
MSSRAKFLTALIYVLALYGFATMKGMALVLAIPLLVYLILSFWQMADSPALRIERRATMETAVEGDLLPITLTVHNEGGDLAKVEIQEMLPAGASLHSGETQLLTSLASGETAELNYTLAVQRGALDLSEVMITVWDRLGLSSWSGVEPAATHLTVTPRYQPLRSLVIRSLRTMGFTGPLNARRGGSGSSFFGVREYQPGDSLRRINWRAAARQQDQLFTTEFEQEQIANIGLILDMRSEHALRIGANSLLDHGVRATAALADSLLQDGHRVGLLLYGFGLDGVLPGYGKRQRDRILRKLAEARPVNSQIFRSLNYMPTRLFPARAQLIFVSSLAEGDETMLFRLRAHGYGVMIVSPNSVEFEAQLLPEEQLRPLAIRLALIERQIFLRRLRQGGILTVDWPVERPLDDLLQTALRQTPPAHERMGRRL